MQKPGSANYSYQRENIQMFRSRSARISKERLCNMTFPFPIDKEETTSSLLSSSNTCTVWLIFHIAKRLTLYTLYTVTWRMRFADAANQTTWSTLNLQPFFSSNLEGLIHGKVGEVWGS